MELLLGMWRGAEKIQGIAIFYKRMKRIKMMKMMKWNVIK